MACLVVLFLKTIAPSGIFSGILKCSAGIYCFFLGLTREPLVFSRFRRERKSVAIWTARLVYIPIGGICIFFGVRDLIATLR